MAWKFIEVRTHFFLRAARGELSNKQTSSTSVAYTLLGGFVVVVGPILPIPHTEPSNCHQVQPDFLCCKREGELPTMSFGIPRIINLHEQLYINEVTLGTVFGITLGPHVLGIFDPRSWTGVTDTLTREIMRIVLATGLFAIGVELPTRYMADHAKSLVIMVVPTMAFGWLVSGGKLTSGITSNTSLLSPFLISASIHPHHFPKTKFYIFTCHLGMLNSNRPDYQRRRYRSVAKIIKNFAIHSDFLTSRWKICREKCTP